MIKPERCNGADPTDNEEVIFAQIGLLLLMVQDFEWILSQSIKLVFANRAEWTTEKILSADKRTLGTLMKDLRKRTNIYAEVDALLVDLLNDRNLFVHNLRRQDWFDTKSTAGRNRIWEFFLRFQPKLQDGMMLFTAIVLDFSQRIGFDSNEFEVLRKTRFWDEIITKYSPKVGLIKTK